MEGTLRRAYDLSGGAAFAVRQERLDTMADIHQPECHECRGVRGHAAAVVLCCLPCCCLSFVILTARAEPHAHDHERPVYCCHAAQVCVCKAGDPASCAFSSPSAQGGNVGGVVSCAPGYERQVGGRTLRTQQG